MAKTPNDSVIPGDAVENPTEESFVGDRFEGESKSELNVGKEKEVIVTLYKRNFGPEAGTYFMRVSLRSQLQPKIIGRYNVDLDRYASERDFCKMVFVGAAALAEIDCEKRGAQWDVEHIGRQAVKAAKELLREVSLV